MKRVFSFLLALGILGSCLSAVCVQAQATEPTEPTLFAEAASEAETCMQSAAAAISDYSEYTFQLWSASAAGATGPLYMNCYYLQYQWWSTLSFMGGGLNDRFESRVRFEQDGSGGKYRLYYYGVHENGKTLYTTKYYLTGETVPAGQRTESSGFFYGDLYGYEYIDFTTSSSDALLWEVTSSGYLKTSYNGSTHYLWTTTTPYGDTARYVLRLRTSTAAKGTYGMPVALTDESGRFVFSSAHAHIPGEKQVTKEEAATCTSAQVTYQSLLCKDETCGLAIASSSYKTGDTDPGNHTGLAERIIHDTPATCQAPRSYEIEVYCSDCEQVIEVRGPFQEGEPGDHISAEPVQENIISGSCMSKGSYESVIYCQICSLEISRTTVDTGFGTHCEAIDAAVEPTCTEPGLTEGKHCTVCGEILTAQTVVEATGQHSFADGKCEYCSVIRGDLNGDGTVDEWDAVYLLWCVLFPEQYTTNQDPDFNGSGAAEDDDALHLLWHTLFPEQYPL